jgi:hypothetical protein
MAKGIITCSTLTQASFRLPAVGCVYSRYSHKIYGLDTLNNMNKQLESILSFIAILLLGASLGYLAIIGLDKEIDQNTRDLERFRSQGFPITHSLHTGEGLIEQSAQLNTITNQLNK